jgi:hypothetical protein
MYNSPLIDAVVDRRREGLSGGCHLKCSSILSIAVDIAVAIAVAPRAIVIAVVLGVVAIAAVTAAAAAFVASPLPILVECWVPEHLGHATKLDYCKSIAGDVIWETGAVVAVRNIACHRYKRGHSFIQARYCW